MIDEALFILLIWPTPLVITKHFIHASHKTSKKLWNKYQRQKYLLTKVMTKSLQNRKKITKKKLSKKEREEKHIAFVTLFML